MTEVGLIGCSKSKSKSLEAGLTRCKSLEAGLTRCKSLSLDIQEEILLRSEVTDLIGCKSVCKSWYSLISSDRFAKSHLKRQIQNTRIIAFSAGTSGCDATCLCKRRRASRLVGSSNGLVCISRYDTDFLVVNPSTRELKQLINLPGYPVCARVSGFGYDSSIDDFKVVVGYRVHANDPLAFYVLELKKNIWRSVDVDWGDYEFSEGSGILCNGAIHWLDPKSKQPVFPSFDLSKEVLNKTPLPKLDEKWILGTMKDRLCVFRFPNNHFEEFEIWVLSNDQVSWERKLLPPGYDTNKTLMGYVPHKNILPGHVHIWLKEEGSAAPVLLRIIDHPHNKHISPRDHHQIRLATFSECNYNFDNHVFVKSLVSPHGMGHENGSCNKERVKRKISPDGDRRSVKSRRESLVSHNSNGGRAKSKRQSDSDSDDDGRRVEEKRRERESHRGRAKIKRQSLVSSDSDDDGRRVEGKRRERESHKGRAESKRQSHVSSDSDDDGRRVEGKRRERESHKGRAESKRQSHVSFNSDDDGRRVEGKRRERESHKGRAESKRQSHVSSDSDDDGRRVEGKRRERESHVFHGSDKGRGMMKRESHISSDSDHDGKRVKRKRREGESLMFHSSNGGRAKSKRQSHVSSNSNDDGRRGERKRRERES